jgi:hypothetical protein
MSSAAHRTPSVLRATFGIGCLLIVSACSVASLTGGPTADGTSPATPSVSASVAPETAAEVLAGRPVAGIATGGADVVLRLGAEGFRLPADENLYDAHGDRALSARKAADLDTVNLVVRDLDGQVVREIESGMQIPQAAIVQGDDVYFAGVDAEEGDAGLVVTDRGAWVARGDRPPEPLVAPRDRMRYEAFHVSPDGRTVGLWACSEEACSTILIGPDGHAVEIPKPGLIALANDVALLIGRFSDVTAYGVADGAELWRAETDGAYYERFATSDGSGFVISSVEDAGNGDGNSTDQLRIEVLDAQTGAIEKTVLVSTEETLLWVAPSLSTDRFVALTEEVLPHPDEGSQSVLVVDLGEGQLLDTPLELGAVR